MTIFFFKLQDDKTFTVTVFLIKIDYLSSNTKSRFFKTLLVTDHIQV